MVCLHQGKQLQRAVGVMSSEVSFWVVQGFSSGRVGCEAKALAAMREEETPYPPRSHSLFSVVLFYFIFLPLVSIPPFSIYPAPSSVIRCAR